MASLRPRETWLKATKDQLAMLSTKSVDEQLDEWVIAKQAVQGAQGPILAC